MTDGTRLVFAGKAALSLKAGIALVAISAFVNIAMLSASPCVGVGEEL